jgi:hypothetical protein
MLLDSLSRATIRKNPTGRKKPFDAANILRFGEDLIYLVSAPGN